MSTSFLSDRENVSCIYPPVIGLSNLGIPAVRPHLHSIASNEPIPVWLEAENTVQERSQVENTLHTSLHKDATSNVENPP